MTAAPQELTYRRTPVVKPFTGNGWRDACRRWIANVPYLSRRRARQASTANPVESALTQVERERQHLQQRLGILTQSLPIGVFEADVAGRCHYITETCAQILCVSFLDSFVGSWFDYLHPEDRAEVEENWRAAWRHSEPFATQCRVVARDGGQRWIFIHGWPLMTDLSSVYVGTIEDITEQRRSARELERHADSLEYTRNAERQKNQQLQEMVAELQAARSAAESGARTKNEFLANMSHEIRTPLTAILGFTDVLLEETPEELEQDAPLPTIRRNAEYLLELLNDILDLSKIEAGKLALEWVPCSPRQIAEDVHQLMQIRLRGKSTTLQLELDDSLPETIVSDPTRLKQILVNLVSNSIKFTERGQITIQVELEAHDSEPTAAAQIPQIMIRVTDTGIGMTAEQLARLFRPFTQADASTTRRFGGTGLGLTICKDFVEKLGGSIQVVSQPGIGSTFTVVVPAKDAVYHSAPTTVNTAVGAVTELRFHAPVTEAPQPYTELRGARVLLAEDGLDNQRLITFLLNKVKIETTVVGNGVDAFMTALDAWRNEQSFDAILMDMQMPEMDGYDATRQLRQAGYRGPIIAITANSMQGDRERCLSAGCSEYTCKPINRADLLRKLTEAIVSNRQVNP